MAGSLVIDPGSVSNTISQVKNNVADAIMLHKIDIGESRASYSHAFILVIIISLTTYLSFMASTILRFKVIRFVSNLIFPIFPMLGCIFICFYVYIASCVYSELLSDRNRNIFKYIYICLLGAVYLPIVVFAANIYILSKYKLLFFILMGLFSEYYCRSSMTNGRHFEDQKQKTNFIFMSFVINLGFYCLIIPIFFT